MTDKNYANELLNLAKKYQVDILSEEFAKILDEQDELKNLRFEYFYPKMKDLPFVDLTLVNGESDSVYLCGHSLGLEPKGVKKYVDRELEKWSKMGVYGHFMGDTPWALCDEFVIDGNARMVGALKDEIAVMNGHSVNLHLLMVSFYRPTKERHKILLEDRAFPSDHFAIQSQIQFHNFSPEESMLIMKPREGEHCIRTEDIIKCIKDNGRSIALILFSGVHYYTGQLFDIPAITKVGQEMGCVVGWDLAHAAGNVPLYLHDWGVDFAAWCSYKYMSASCGGLAVVFMHEKHAKNPYPKFLGWWSDDKSHRMNMTNELHLTPGPAGYRISNPPILLVCPMLASLDIFNKTTMEILRKKSLILTGYLEYLVEHYLTKNSKQRTTKSYCEIVTPKDPAQRGCQLSLKFSISVDHVFKELQKRGVVCDKRLPFVLRVAPVHLYNNFTDVKRFVDTLIVCLGSCD